MNLFLLLEKARSDSNINIIDDSHEDGEESMHTRVANQRLKRTRLLKRIVWKFILVLMALFFMAAAYVQHNDPDPYLWMPAYIVPVLITVSLIISTPDIETLQGTIRWMLLNAVIALHIAYCCCLGGWTLTYYMYRRIRAFVTTKKGHLSDLVFEANMQVEEAKELFGLCLVVAWLSFLSDGNFIRFGKKGILIGAMLTGLPILSWMFMETLFGENECASQLTKLCKPICLVESGAN